MSALNESFAFRHSLAHLLAWAMQELYPGVRYGIGPATDTGFFYDFELGHSLSEGDLGRIEAKMQELAAKKVAIEPRVVSKEDAQALFESKGQPYKLEILDALSDQVDITVFRMGDFEDLCKGPHVANTGSLRHFKLTRVSGAYWKGDKRRETLQRIQGVGFESKEELKAYLRFQEEAAARDHRKLGRELGLFHLDEHSPGTVFWHPKGWAVWQRIEQYMRGVYRENGYFEVKGPQILDKSLWETTGHWDKYRENMFTTESEKREYALKPMNCPGHILIYKQGVKSYRDLPLRYGEFGQCHRNEPTGGLHGIMRVRGFTQDDGHIFCTEEQIQPECDAFTKLLQSVYADFGFTEILYKVATRPEHRIGADELWDKAENALMTSLTRAGCEYQVAPGDGAFYGPKIEYTLKDALGRHWQCGTIQVDFSLPERLGAEYVNAQGGREAPVMIHRAILGSLERFIGILLEHHSGVLPYWLAPIQMVVAPIADAQIAYAAEVVSVLRRSGVRVIIDSKNEKISKKVREHSVQKVPFLIIVGDKEVTDRVVSIRKLGEVQSTTVPLEEVFLWCQARSQ